MTLLFIQEIIKLKVFLKRSVLHLGIEKRLLCLSDYAEFCGTVIAYLELVASFTITLVCWFLISHYSKPRRYQFFNRYNEAFFFYENNSGLRFAGSTPLFDY